MAGKQPTSARYWPQVAGFCRVNKLPMPATELRFHPTRKWRFDFAWPDQKVAFEVDGGVWTGGRHTRGAGFLKDQEKRNAAVVLGWRVIHSTPGTLAEGLADVAACLHGEVPDGR